MEALYRRLEAWGYPTAAINWLRQRRLVVIAMLGLLSWLLCAGLVFVGLHAFGFFAGLQPR